MDNHLNNEIKQLNLEADAELQESQLSFEEELEPEPHQPDQEVIQALNAVLGMTANSLAPNWNIQPEEIEIVSQAAEVVLDKYMPNVKNSLGCEFALVLAVGGIVLPRLNMPRYEKSESIEELDKKETQANTSENLSGDGLGDFRAMQESEVSNGG